MVSVLDTQMLSLNCCKNQPLPLPQLSFDTNKNRPIQLLSFWLGNHDGFKKTSKNKFSSSCTVHAVDKDSKQFEIDPDKAKDALQKLDQQLQSLSKKQVSPPKIKASDVKLTRRRDDKAMEEEMVQDFSGSVLANTTIALFLFTIFYNVLFYAVIKPAIDGPEFEPTEATVVRDSPEAAFLLVPSMPDNILQKL